eukprot:38337-Chlamydomonas_euryale.AAC.2
MHKALRCTMPPTAAAGFHTKTPTATAGDAGAAAAAAASAAGIVAAGVVIVVVAQQQDEAAAARIRQRRRHNRRSSRARFRVLHVAPACGPALLGHGRFTRHWRCSRLG